MRKFASMLAITLSCLSLSAFAQEINEETVNNSEVTIENDGDTSGDSSGDVAPQHSDEADCGCDGKPKD